MLEITCRITFFPSEFAEALTVRSRKQTKSLRKRKLSQHRRPRSSEGAFCLEKCQISLFHPGEELVIRLYLLYICSMDMKTTRFSRQSCEECQIWRNLEISNFYCPVGICCQRIAGELPSRGSCRQRTSIDAAVAQFFGEKQ